MSQVQKFHFEFKFDAEKGMETLQKESDEEQLLKDLPRAHSITFNGEIVKAAGNTSINREVIPRELLALCAQTSARGALDQGCYLSNLNLSPGRAENVLAFSRNSTETQVTLTPSLLPVDIVFFRSDSDSEIPAKLINYKATLTLPNDLSGQASLVVDAEIDSSVELTLNRNQLISLIKSFTGDSLTLVSLETPPLRPSPPDDSPSLPRASSSNSLMSSAPPSSEASLSSLNEKLDQETREFQQSGPLSSGGDKISPLILLFCTNNLFKESLKEELEKTEKLDVAFLNTLKKFELSPEEKREVAGLIQRQINTSSVDKKIAFLVNLRDLLSRDQTYSKPIESIVKTLGLQAEDPEVFGLSSWQKFTGSKKTQTQNIAEAAISSLTLSKPIGPSASGSSVSVDPSPPGPS